MVVLFSGWTQGNNDNIVKNCFQKVGQDPWYDGGDDKLVAHLNDLQEDSHYKPEGTDYFHGKNAKNKTHALLDNNVTIEEN